MSNNVSMFGKELERRPLTLNLTDRQRRLLHRWFISAEMSIIDERGNFAGLSAKETEEIGPLIASLMMELGR